MIQTTVSNRNTTVWKGKSERIVLLHEESWEVLENIRENVTDNDGQFIALNVATVYS